MHSSEHPPRNGRKSPQAKLSEVLSQKVSCDHGQSGGHFMPSANKLLCLPCIPLGVGSLSSAAMELAGALVVLDGANVALSAANSKSDPRKVVRIATAIQYFKEKGARCIAFVPAYWTRRKRPGKFCKQFRHSTWFIQPKHRRRKQFSPRQCNPNRRSCCCSGSC